MVRWQNLNDLASEGVSSKKTTAMDPLKKCRVESSPSIFADNVEQLQNFLVGGLEHFLIFHILGKIILTDSYFSEG